MRVAHGIYAQGIAVHSKDDLSLRVKKDGWNVVNLNYLYKFQIVSQVTKVYQALTACFIIEAIFMKSCDYYYVFEINILKSILFQERAEFCKALPLAVLLIYVTSLPLAYPFNFY